MRPTDALTRSRVGIAGTRLRHCSGGDSSRPSCTSSAGRADFRTKASRLLRLRVVEQLPCAQLVQRELNVRADG